MVAAQDPDRALLRVDCSRRSPCSAAPAASTLLSSSAHVSEPRSSTSAVAFGARAAESPMPLIALAP